MPDWGKWKKRLKKLALAGALCFSSLAGGAYGATTAINSIQPKENRTAVLISDSHYEETRPTLSPILKTLMYVPLTIYYNVDNSGVDWILHAQSSDLEQILQDENYKNIVLVGHGSYNSWSATDRTVTEEDIIQWQTTKKEELLQLTCVKNDGSTPFGNEISDANYHYKVGNSDIVLPTLMAVDLLTGFPVLKGQAEYTDFPYFQLSLYFIGDENVQRLEKAWHRLFKKFDNTIREIEDNQKNPAPVPDNEKPQPYMLWGVYVLTGGRRNL
ncbi:MAG: hypothetical protein HY363_03360 [Candidatus Aenigmarchaeota archaeon]|nr:hypothetical protein [Candidatus Aenigmarchaeota archaeon]